MELQGALACLWFLSVLFVVTGFNNGEHRTVEVVGLGECADCRENNIKTSHAFSGLRVAVDCKSPHGHLRTRGVGALDEYGNFKVSLPQEMVEDGELKEDCYAQLHSASAEPCPSHGNSKIVTKSVSDDNNKHTLGPAAGKLTFSSALCTSAFFWHFFKHPQFPFPPKDNDKPPVAPVPVKKKPPAAVPTYKKPPTTSPAAKKPCPPKEKTPSPTPTDKPLPPPTPISDPPPTSTSPPFFKFFPHPFQFKKQPCPPLPKMEPPKYFYQHPWFGNWPPTHS